LAKCPDDEDTVYVMNSTLLYLYPWALAENFLDGANSAKLLYVPSSPSTDVESTAL